MELTATANVVLNTSSTTQQGIKFTPGISSSNVKLDASGLASYEVYGALQLIDKTLNVSNNLTFTYDLEFTAQ